MAKKTSSGKDTLLFVVLGIVMAFTVNYGMSFAMATEYPIVAVESNSMVPFFYRGDILVVQGTKPENLKVGDVIIYSVAGKGTPIVHRILTKNGDGTFQTKGDANTGQLPWERSIDASQIKGKEIFILPLLGWVKVFITETVAPNILVFAAIALIIAFIYLITNKK